MRWLASIILLIATTAFAAEGSTLLHPLFQDHAVLQRDRAVAVWGTTQPGAEVAVAIADQSATTRASADGTWKVSLPAMPAGGPYEMSVSVAGRVAQTVRDVLVGDVWLCSGQSNMEMAVRQVSNAGTEIADAHNDRIRLFTVQRASSAQPLRTFSDPVSWQAVTSDTIREFSAACYFFGRELQRVQGVPQGLIHSSWGGSIIQAWTSAEALRKLPGYDAPLQLLALHAQSPQRAEQQWHDITVDWWRQHIASDWSVPTLDDAAWPTIRPVDFWEKSTIPEFEDFDGLAWYRATVNLTAQQAREGATLLLGPIDDMDTTWVNGQRVGGLEGWDTPREYALAKGVLKPGRNVIAVAVLDSGGGGGMWGLPSQRVLRLGSGATIPLDGEWRYRIAGTLAQTGAPPHAPWMTAIGTTTLYNAMIAPLAGYSLRGAAWYQGESNTMEAEEYARLLPTMMQDWRNAFGQDLPFLVVQLAGFGAATSVPGDSTWAALREVQRRVVDADGHAALATAIDIGDRYDIHPTNKQEVGRRLALAARHLVFGENVVASGPAATGAKRAGEKVIVDFANVAGGLVVIGGNRPAGFELCDTKRQCRFVDASVQGDHVALDAAGIADAAVVRYAWAKSPVCNLYNTTHLPALPFELPVQ